MIAGWIASGVALLGVLAMLLRISFQLGGLIQRFGDHVSSSDKLHADQEQRIRSLERRPRRRPASASSR